MDARIAVKSAPANQPRPLWRNRDYVLLWGGQTISNFGSQTSQVAFPLLMLAVTHSPLQAGLIGGLRFVSYAVLGLPAGAWVDRVDRKRLMIGCDLLRALALGSLPVAFLFGGPTLLHLYVTALVEGSLYVLFTIAETSCLPHVVPKEQLAAAIGQDQASDGVANLLGPSLGGILYGLHQLFPFLADAISYTISVVSLLFVRVSFQSEQRVVARRNLSAEMAEGFRWLWQHPLVRFIAFHNTGINFSSVGVTLLLITLLQQQQASSTTIGLILATGGIGYIVGSVLSPLVKKRFSYRQITTTLAWGYLLFWSLYLVAFTPFLLGIVTAALFSNHPIQNVASSTLRTMLIPDEMRGRVNAINLTISSCAVPLGMLVTGALLQLVGAQATIVFFSAMFLVMAVRASVSPHLRKAPSWAELERLQTIANDLSQAGTRGISQIDTWVGFDRYLVKLPDDPHATVREVYAFPSARSVAAHIRREKWEGIDRYLLKLPDKQKNTEEVHVYQSVTNAAKSFTQEKWSGIDGYLLRLPDRRKATPPEQVLPDSSPLGRVKWYRSLEVETSNSGR